MSCQREGLVFLSFDLETLCGLDKGAITQIKLRATALDRCKGGARKKILFQNLGTGRE